MDTLRQNKTPKMIQPTLSRVTLRMSRKIQTAEQTR